MPSTDLVSKEGGADERQIISTFGVATPRLIYGTAWKKERTAALVELALRQGFRGVDTACQPKHYNERGVGEGLAAAFGSGLARSAVYVQTKFTPFAGQDPNDLPYDPKASLSQQVLQSFQASLRNLRTDYLDGLLLHSPYPDDKDIRAFCRERGIIYQSFWTLTANPEVLAAPDLIELAAKYGRSPAQIFFRYLTQLDIACLTGTSSKDHMQQDLSIFQFRLSQAECESLGALLLRSP